MAESRHGEQNKEIASKSGISGAVVSAEDQALMAEVFAKIPSAIVVVDTHGVIKKANESAHLLLGEPNLLGRRWVEVVSAVFRPRNDDGHEISTRDGKRLQVATLPLSSGQLIQMTDLTETRLLQDKIAHMERLSSLGRMAASLAHQIRTPLSAAMLYAANLGNVNLQPTARKRFQEKLVGRLEALEAQVSDILMFARSNEQSVSEIDATSLIESTANNVTALLSKTNAQLMTVVDPELKLPIMGNTTALTGALSNLIANAVEAGAHQVVLKLEPRDDKVVFSVANDGPQIPEEMRTKIFEPFFTSKSSGTGLGLAVVTAVTKVHQGIISLEQWPAPFLTVFTIVIPRFVPTALQAPSVSSPASAGAPSSASALAADSESATATALEQEGISELEGRGSVYGSGHDQDQSQGDSTAGNWGFDALSLEHLPPTAAGITKQAALAANTATSIAFAAYARRRQTQANMAAAEAAAAIAASPAAAVAVAASSDGSDVLQASAAASAATTDAANTANAASAANGAEAAEKQAFGQSI